MVEKISVKQKRVYPWNIIGDNGALVLTTIILLIGGPIMAITMPISVVSLEILKAIWNWTELNSTVVNTIEDTSIWIGKRILKKEQDSKLLPYIILLSFWAPLLFGIAVYRQLTVGFEMWFAIVYHLLRIGPRFRLFAHCQVLCHHEGHCHYGLFRDSWAFLNGWFIQWIIGPFYGQFPTSYSIAHNKIHHRYDNNLTDVHTNWDLDRSKPISLLIYLPRFFAYWINFSPTLFFYYRKQYNFVKKLLLGTTYHIGLITVSYLITQSWPFVFCYLIYPIFEAGIFLGAISYMWHMFLDPNDPENSYIASLSILKGKDNIYNEDYHIIHHLNPGVHWSDIPQEFVRNNPKYQKNHATVFRDCEQGELMFWILSGNWDEITNHYVDLSGKLSFAEKKKLLLERASFTPDFDSENNLIKDSERLNEEISEKKTKI